MTPIMEQFNKLVSQADNLTSYQIDQASPEELYTALWADGNRNTAQRLRAVAEQLGYFKNGEAKI